MGWPINKQTNAFIIGRIFKKLMTVVSKCYDLGGFLLLSIFICFSIGECIICRIKMLKRNKKLNIS